MTVVSLFSLVSYLSNRELNKKEVILVKTEMLHVNPIKSRKEKDLHDNTPFKLLIQFTNKPFSQYLLVGFGLQLHSRYKLVPANCLLFN